jgi:hypothetical protein
MDYYPIDPPPGGASGSWPVSTRTELIVIIVVILAIAGMVTLVIAHSGDEQQPDVTQLSQSLLVDRSSFPVIDGAEWTGPQVETAGDRLASSGSNTTPPVCEAFFAGPRPTQEARIGLSSQGITFGAMIEMTAERPDFNSLLSSCGTVQTGDGRQYSIEQRNLSGLPDWSTTVLQRQAGNWLLSTVGFHRGVFLSASRRQAQGQAAPRGFGLDTPSRQDNDALTKLFNDQVAKLDAA